MHTSNNHLHPFKETGKNKLIHCQITPRAYSMHASLIHPLLILHRYFIRSACTLRHPHVRVAHSLATPYLGRASLPHSPPFPFPPAYTGIVSFILPATFYTPPIISAIKLSEKILVIAKSKAGLNVT